MILLFLVKSLIEI